MEWLKPLGVLFGWLSSLFTAFKWGKYVGLIENQMRIEDVTCYPPAKKFPECNKPASLLIGGELHSIIATGGTKIKLAFHKGKISEVICNYLNRQTGLCEWCEAKSVPCRYLPLPNKNKGFKALIAKFLSLT